MQQDFLRIVALLSTIESTKAILFFSSGISCFRGPATNIPDILGKTGKQRFGAQCSVYEG